MAVNDVPGAPLSGSSVRALISFLTVNQAVASWSPHDAVTLCSPGLTPPGILKEAHATVYEDKRLPKPASIPLERHRAAPIEARRRSRERRSRIAMVGREREALDRRRGVIGPWPGTAPALLVAGVHR